MRETLFFRFPVYDDKALVLVDAVSAGMRRIVADPNHRALDTAMVETATNVLERL